MGYKVLKLFVLLGLLVLALSGCGQSKPNNITSTFQDMYNDFIAVTQANGFPIQANNGITIKFETLRMPGDNGGIVIGQCSAVGYSIPGATISIDQAFWDAATDAGKRVLMYHELGHCLLDRQHSASQHSIMFPVIDLPSVYYASEQVAMDTELVVNHGK